jgi:aromatic ring-opening dioxygenase catalytic subunit (LigB family)
MPTPQLPVFFISHGGGPWPWMMEQTGGAYDKLAASLREMPGQIGPAAKALLVVSAHWEEREFTLMTSPQPPMLYDYGGFPEHTYHVKYGAPGAPAVAERVREVLGAAGIATRADAERGFDHGTFSPLAVAFPAAEMPVLQLSLKQGLDPEEHLALGRALAPLRDEGIAIIGSGLSYHNLRAFGPAGSAPSKAFDRWLQERVVGASAADRAEALRDWRSAPLARQAHPREEHLLPLMVAAGAAGDDPALCVYHEDNFFGALAVSSFRFGASAAPASN